MSDGLLIAIVAAVVSIVTGGGMWAFLTGRLTSKGAREESEIGRLRADIAAMNAKNEDCEIRYEALERRMWAVEQAQTSHLARWLKDGERRVTWINDKAFLSIFAPLGFRRDQVLGHTFAQLLDDLSAVAEMDRLDQAALARPDLAASNVIRMHPSLPMMVVVKQVASGLDGELVFEGYAYRTNDRMIADGQGGERQFLQIATSADALINQE